MKNFSVILSIMLACSLIAGSLKMIATAHAEIPATAAGVPADPVQITPTDPALPASPAPLASETPLEVEVVPLGEEELVYDYDAVDSKGKGVLSPIAEFTEVIKPGTGPIVPGVEYFGTPNPVFTRGNPDNMRGPDPCPANP